jgi:nucleotide-binding universal stress UspA family protein
MARGKIISKERYMNKKKHILIPLDGSAFSLQVLESVKAFLPPEENQLILLTVERDSGGLVAGPAQAAAIAGASYTAMYNSHRDAMRAHHPIYATQEQESTTAAVRSAMQKTVRQLESYGYEVELAVRFGEPVEEILNYIEAASIDLIAMTTHGRSGIGRLLFGSVAAAIMDRVNIPILLLRPSPQS